MPIPAMPLCSYSLCVAAIENTRASVIDVALRSRGEALSGWPLHTARQLRLSLLCQEPFTQPNQRCTNVQCQDVWLL